ncbi:hypothetical protein U1289_00090 [Enterococcus cecorum]|uniref:hypothetical protein n=2 Tax=Enterococcus cecorum TaxID=44008 RepID=UPI002ACA108D|nr:hypothetical protein [Enterococcus cecorum]MDZ5576522.1 hypothetical protein [Enterococcus cecorum]
MVLEWKYLLQLLRKNILYRIVIIVLFAIFLLIVWSRGIDMASHSFIFKFPRKMEEMTFYQLLFHNIMPILVYFGATLLGSDVFPIMISEQSIWIKIRNRGSFTLLLLYYTSILIYSLLIIGFVNGIHIVYFHHLLSVTESTIGILFILFLQQILSVGYLSDITFSGYIFLIFFLICLATTPAISPFQLWIALIGNVALIGINPLLLKNKEYL